MSRLDDELKVAFQRREPSADFAARVLARLDEAPLKLAPPSLWQRLADWFAVPAWRFAAAGAMALLLVVIGFVVMRAQRATNFEQATPAVIATTGNTPSVLDDGVKVPLNSAVAQSGPVRTGGRSPIHHHAAVAKAPKPSAEAEAAKEKVLFALQITSDTLNEVQRAISADRPTGEKPEPVQNR
ncbi:MAG TPA: hypothetical protein VKA60_01400 [Blastocatellia bacterium]|nr:hypothetical protein [Blastocatellia bacterium]